ncbi:MAG TPA: hypothetical protein HPQ03_00100 [Deltaproteobacteria bacterium]|nr:hypothetical protein [Deltaproteobacteria bacterium]
MFDYTDFLYARPTFISGVSRVMDLGNTLNEYNSTFLPSVADYYAIKSDWIMVGSDIQAGISAYDEKEKQA